MDTLTLLSVKIPAALKRRLEAAARREGRSLSSFTRYHLDQKLSDPAPAPEIRITGIEKTRGGER